MLQQEQKTPLSINFLKKLAGPDVENIGFFYYDDLYRIRNLDSLFDGKQSVILLMEIKGPQVNPVGHFITILNYPNYIEHFDSYGLSLQSELIITKEPGYLANILNKSGKKVIQNTFQFQALKDDVETCGRWCVARARMYKFDLNKFKSFFQQKITSYDDKVTLLTYFNG